MRRISLVIVGDILISIALCVSSILVGRAMPPTTRIQEFRLDVCKLPCWLGIEVGKTTLGEAWKRLDVSFPKSDYEISTDGSDIWVVDNVTREILTIRFNAPNSIDSQTKATLITAIELGFGRINPLTAGELFSLVGGPERIGLGYSSAGTYTYALFCALRVRATPYKHEFDIASLDGDMAAIEIYDTPEKTCNDEVAVAWKGFIGGYQQRLYNR